MRIENLTKGTTLSFNCEIANSFWKRFMGLMGKDNLPQGNGLVIVPCNSIHMFFMKFPLDIVFIDKNNIVVYVIENIKPWRASKIIRKAHSVIELPVGTIKSSQTYVGDQLEII